MPSKFSEIWHKIASPNIRTCSVEKIFIKNEYIMNHSVKLNLSKKNIVFIFDASQWNRGLPSFEGAFERIKFIQQLNNIPKKLKSISEIYCKLHPGCSDIYTWKISKFNDDCILPLDSNLNDILNQSSLIISVNYFSSPTIQAIMKGVPVIHYESVKKLNPIFSYSIAKYLAYDKYLAVVDNLNDLWELSYNVLSDKKFRYKLIYNQSRLSEYLLPKTKEQVSSVIYKIIINNNNIFKI